jgi:hypothetical protein
MGRIPYAAEIKVGALPPGIYALFVSVTDRNAKGASATQSLKFTVE